jgi:hypothetical protein
MGYLQVVGPLEKTSVKGKLLDRINMTITDPSGKQLEVAAWTGHALQIEEARQQLETGSIVSIHFGNLRFYLDKPIINLTNMNKPFSELILTPKIYPHKFQQMKEEMEQLPAQEKEHTFCCEGCKAIYTELKTIKSLLQDMKKV